MDEKEQQAAELVGDEIPGFVLWVIAFGVGLLFTAAFYITGLWLGKGTGIEEAWQGALIMGLIPGMVGGGTLTGLVYAIHDKWTVRALIVSLLGLGLPLAGVPPLFGVVNVGAVVVAPGATILGGLLVPALIRFVRGKGWGKIKGPKGSWEENF